MGDGSEVNCKESPGPAGPTLCRSYKDLDFIRNARSVHSRFHTERREETHRKEEENVREAPQRDQ